jgi:membrane associated rhomboid family serine protease
MGVHDRDYYREDDEPGQRIGPPTVLVSLIILNAVLFALNFLLSNETDPNELTDALALYSDSFVRPWKLYGLFTSGFVHDPKLILHILFNMYILYMFGRDVQQRFGQPVFLGFYLCAIVVASLAWLTWKAVMGEINASAVGASGGVVAVTVAYCTLWPNRQLSFFGLVSFPAWAYGGILVALDLLNALRDETQIGEVSRIAWQAHVGGAAFGFAFAKLSPRFVPELQRALSFSPRRWWRSRKLRVYQEQESRAERDFESLERQADATLAKLKEFGESSLTPRERKILEDYSRHVRQRRR